MKESKHLTACLIGATGLVGSELLKLLLADPRFEAVHVYTRRTTGVEHGKFFEHLVDFRKISLWQNQIQGDVAFSCLGTTRTQAGSLEAQYEVDYTFQADFAKACRVQGLSTFVLISAMGASAKSPVPYSRMKGQLEDFVQTLGFDQVRILQPGPLQGHREIRRIGEEISVPITRFISFLPGLSSLRPVSGMDVAHTTLSSVFSSGPLKIYNPIQVRLNQV